MIAQITSFQTRLSLIGDFLIWPSLSGISPKLHPIHLENYNSPRSTEPVLDAKYYKSCAMPMHMGYEAMRLARMQAAPVYAARVASRPILCDEGTAFCARIGGIACDFSAGVLQ